MEITHQLYIVELTPANSQSSDCESAIYRTIANQFSHKVVTDNVKKKILEEIQLIHDKFFKANPRKSKDKNFKFNETMWDRGGHLDSYTEICLGESMVSSVRFYPKNVIDFNADNEKFIELKAGEE